MNWLSPGSSFCKMSLSTFLMKEGRQMAKVRKDSKGRALKKGEGYRKDFKLYYYSYTDPYKKRKVIYAKDLPELRDLEKALERDRLYGLDIYVQSKSDVNYVFDRYIETKRDLKSTTMTNYKYTYNRYVRNGFGKRKISSVKYSDILLFYNSVLDSGLSISTVDNIHSVLHPTFQMAVRDSVIRINPTDGAMAEVKRNTKKSTGVRHALTREEENAFLDYIVESPNEIRWVPLLTFMFGTGCRIGEIIGLRWNDIDMDKRIININHNITYYPRSENSYKCSFEVTTTKTDAGKRNIPMLDRVYDALLLEKKNQRMFGYICNAEIDGLSNFIFCNRNGNIHNPASVNRVIKRIVSDYNAKEIISAKREHRDPVIVPRFSCHITRHTFCARLCENETNIKVIQSVMGHKDIQTTLDIYAEVSDQKKSDVFQDLNKDIW